MFHQMVKPKAKQVEIEICMTNRIEALFQLFERGKKV